MAINAAGAPGNRPGPHATVDYESTATGVGISGDSRSLAGNGLDNELNECSLDEIRLWGTSFDRLMKNPQGRNLFHKFLVSEFSDENIAFWQACEQLKRESNPEKIEEKARLIYDDYISIISPKEVRFILLLLLL